MKEHEASFISVILNESYDGALPQGSPLLFTDLTEHQAEIYRKQQEAKTKGFDSDETDFEC